MDEIRTTEERYTTAITADNLKMDTREHASIGDVDVLTAAGWAPSRLGSALLRLASEYDSSSRAAPRDAGDFLMHAAAQLRDALRPISVEAVQRRARVVAKEAAENEALLFMQRLKTLPDVRRELAIQLKQWGHDKPEDAALAIVAWWLHKVCSKCNGVKYEVIPGTGRTSGRACKACSGTGEARLPQGEMDKRAANYMDDCVQIARARMHKSLGRLTGR